MTHSEQHLTDAQFAALTERIAEVSGIRVPISKRWLLAARVSARMRECKTDDVSQYVGSVRSRDGAHELGQLVELLRVGETKFFRHKGQLRALRRIALPEIAARREAEKQQIVRAWSAGCASGEEAYTLAMLLEDALPAARGWKHEVLATDISEPALAEARAGVYPELSAHGVPAVIAAWALERVGDEVRVTPRARAKVRFEPRNLLEAAYPRGFDIVLCRNVLIYFDRETQQSVVQRLARSVVEGGYLLLGYAEHSASVDNAGLEPIRTEDGIVYRRAGREDTRAQPPARRSAAVAAAAPSSHAARARPAKGARQSHLPRSPRPSTRPSRPPTPRGVPALAGDLSGEPGVAKARAIIEPLLSRRGDAVLDLRELRFADDDVGRVLARAAQTITSQGRALTVLAEAAGIQRFLRRHGIVPPATMAAAPPRGEATS